MFNNTTQPIPLRIKNPAVINVLAE